MFLNYFNVLILKIFLKNILIYFQINKTIKNFLVPDLHPILYLRVLLSPF